MQPSHTKPLFLTLPSPWKSFQNGSENASKICSVLATLLEPQIFKFLSVFGPCMGQDGLQNWVQKWSGNADWKDASLNHFQNPRQALSWAHLNPTWRHLRPRLGLDGLISGTILDPMHTCTHLGWPWRSHDIKFGLQIMIVEIQLANKISCLLPDGFEI